jgi:IclR family mhp operon transcriptional activator
MDSQSVKPKTIRALERGLNVIELLQKGPATLNDIYKLSTLPRPTILRVLRTLEGAGWVRRGLGDGLYRNSFKIGHMVAGLDHTDELAEIAAPHLDALCRKVSWPSDLGVLNVAGLHMELKETSRANSPFLLNRDSIGHVINIPLSAVGRAYLAFCKDTERNEILDRLMTSNNKGDKVVQQEAAFSDILQGIRLAGYATRDSSFGGGQKPFRSDFDDGLNAIAVPIIAQNNILGCITLVWIRKAASIKEITDDYLTDLQKSAAEITAALEHS